MSELAPEKARLLTELLTRRDETPEQLREKEARLRASKYTSQIPVTVVRLERPPVFDVDAQGAIDVPMVVALVKGGEEVERECFVAVRLLSARHLEPDELPRTSAFLSAWHAHWSAFYAMAFEPMEDARSFGLRTSSVLSDPRLSTAADFERAIDHEHRAVDGRLKPPGR